MGLGLLAKATAASSASSPSRGSTGGDTSTPRSATAPQQQQQPQQLHFTKSATALPRTPKASESTAADAAAAAQQPPQPPHSHPQIHLRIPEIEVSLGIPKAVFSAAMAPVNFVGNLFRRCGLVSRVGGCFERGVCRLLGTCTPRMHRVCVNWCLRNQFALS